MAEHALNTSAPESAKPSRRGVMLATARLLALGGAVGAIGAAAPSPDTPDAELIAMCDRIVAGNEEMERLESPYYDVPGEPPAHVRMRSAVLVIESHRLSEAVAEMDAATIKGLRAKARAMLVYADCDPDGVPNWRNHDDLLGWSIARDLLRRA